MDRWVRAAFLGIFLALSFPVSTASSSPPTAANAIRWAATAKACSGNYVRLSGDYQECAFESDTFRNNMYVRPTARLLVIDDRQRLLLIQVHDTRPVHEAFPDMSIFWNTPGGGVEPHETYQQAAQRELWEETGITVDKVDTCVWLHERILVGNEWRVLLQERFFVVFVPSSVISMANLLPYEQDAHKAYYWWTHQELVQSSEKFMPVGLAQLIKPILDGNIPSEPIKLPLYTKSS